MLRYGKGQAAAREVCSLLVRAEHNANYHQRE